ncbi:MAG: helicase-associated domain-containing protein [Anaerolineae bacterium]|nr:helicase-associated domain-containing protein [Anaerolineae bacterium]MCX8067193.1 helicase-associated domain-containing protein [Anaerolineae bacterium]
MGLVAVASCGSEALCFSLTPTGRAFLGLGEVPEESSLPPPVVEADLVVRVPAARRYERFQLSRVADWIGIGEWYTYRLTPASLERARQQRISPERVAEFLEEITGGQVPPTLRGVLKRWETRGPEARLESGVLLRLQDEALLRDLAASPATRRYIREILTPTVAVVAPDGWEEIARTLVARGVLPDVVGL